MDHLIQYLWEKHPHWRIERPSVSNHWFWVAKKGSTEVSAASVHDLDTTLQAFEGVMV